MIKRVTVIVIFQIIACYALLISCAHNNSPASPVTDDCWRGAGINQLPEDSAVRYGYLLVAKTAAFIGPKGSVVKTANGMNCQNCHLEAGTKPWGNNFGGVAANYPKYRDRSGTVESIEKRVNDCIERSLNGQALDSSSKEMRALVAYIKWLGSDVPRGTIPKGSGIMQLTRLTRAADPLKGASLYKTQCMRCHGTNGEGRQDAEQVAYTYPPLWGPHSYTEGAGMFRISRLAGFVKNNMPDPVNYHTPALTDEEAWDVAAFINSQPRPKKDVSHDWPDIRRKPFDYPFGPYADTLPEKRHRFGPWK